MSLRSFVLTLVLGLGLVASALADDELLVRVTPQVVEADHSVSWEQPLSRLTRAGVPVVVNIDAEGLSIRVTVTPFVRGEEYLLVVQGEVRQKREASVHGSSSLQSVLVPPGESIAYFPLGRNLDPAARQMVVFLQVEANHD